MHEKSNKDDWKFFGVSHNLFKFSLIVSFFTLAVWISYMMYQSYYYWSPFVPNGSDLQGTQLYGRNTEGSLKSSLILFFIENAIALLVLLPYSFSRSYWVRTLILQMLFGCWLLLLLLVAMHSSSLFGINILGVFGINVLIFILLISSSIAESRNIKKYKF